MTGAVWRGATDPHDLLVWLCSTPAGYGRRMRLFCVACCRGIVRHAPSPRFADLLDLVEAFAGGAADARRVHDVRAGCERERERVRLFGGSFDALDAADAVIASARDPEGDLGREDPALAELYRLGLALRPDPYPTEVATHAASVAESAHGVPFARERRRQVGLLHCVFGDPLDPVVFDPAWRTPTAVALASGAYADRDWGRLPILADALQDAGCEDESILGHCREPGDHARGCWVLDLILGKA